MKDFFEQLRNADSVMEVLLENKKETLKLAVIVVVALMAVLLYLHQGSAELTIEDTGSEAGQAQTAEETGAQDSAGESEEKGLPLDTDGIVYVDIGGAVKHPMLAELPAGSRVEDAIEAAGGLTKKADLTAVNRAEVLTDGEKIYIPEEGEDLGAAGTGDAFSGGASASGGTSASGGSGGAGASGISSGRININTADVVLLQQLTGVGPVTAQKIVDYREQNGKFSSIEELKNVSGIGDKTFEKMKDDVTI